MTTFKRDFNFNDHLMETIAQNIRKYRKEAGITQEQLAIDIGVSPEYYRKFESTLGSEGMSAINIHKVSIVLNVSIDKLFKENNEEKK